MKVVLLLVVLALGARAQIVQQAQGTYTGTFNYSFFEISPAAPHDQSCCDNTAGSGPSGSIPPYSNHVVIGVGSNWLNITTIGDGAFNQNFEYCKAGITGVVAITGISSNSAGGTDCYLGTLNLYPDFVGVPDIPVAFQFTPSISAPAFNLNLAQCAVRALGMQAPLCPGASGNPVVPNTCVTASLGGSQVVASEWVTLGSLTGFTAAPIPSSSTGAGGSHSDASQVQASVAGLIAVGAAVFSMLA